MVFKEPLPEEEQMELLKIKDDSKAKEKLILHNLKLVLWVAKQYYNPERNELDDLFQLGVLGLIEAIDVYEVDRGATFSTVAVWKIRNSITRGMFNFTEGSSLDEPIPGTEDLSLQDIISDPRPNTEKIATEKVFIEQFKKEFKPKLSELQYNSIVLYYGLGTREHTLKEIADIYNVTSEKVRQARDKALWVVMRSTFIKEIEREVDRRTSFYKSIDYAQPKIKSGSITSSVERLVFQRERIRNELFRKINIKEI